MQVLSILRISFELGDFLRSNSTFHGGFLLSQGASYLFLLTMQLNFTSYHETGVSLPPETLEI